MKTPSVISRAVAIVIAIGALAVTNSRAQLQFTDIRAKELGNIQLYWQSDTNALYRIECTSELPDTTVWRVLYDWYPSHGGNTLWMDAGNGMTTPEILPPRQDPMRFYRLVQIGTNTPSDLPQVAIVSPTNNSLVTGDISVGISVVSTSSIDGIRWFVDGAEHNRASGHSTSNSPLNTCQWANGQHLLFATVENDTGGETTDPADQNGNPRFSVAVTPYHYLNFSNFISDFRASSVFVSPQNSETQTFTAKFEGYSIWTLAFVEFLSSNVVRTVTGTNTTMRFDWDGTDGTNALPNGIYRVFLHAQETAGQDFASQSGEPTAPFGALYWEEDRESGDMVYYVKPPPLPPELEKESAPRPLMQIRIPTQSISENNMSTSSGSETAFEPEDGGGDRSQTTELQPPRIINLFGGSFGVVYQGHHPGVGGPFAAPPNGHGGNVQLPGYTGPYPRLNTPSIIAENFSFRIQRGGVRKGFILGNDDVTGNMLRAPLYGGSEIFEQVNIGLIIGHDVYGVSGDFTIAANGPRTSYYPIYHTGGTGYDWVQLSACIFGRGANLRWMGHLSCNNLQPDVYDDMYNKLALPIGDNLHFFMGASTVSFMVADFGTIFADSIAIGGNAPIMSIKDGWFYAGHQTQIGKNNPNGRTVRFRVAGWGDTFGDTLYEYVDPNSGDPSDITYVEEQIYP
ncbi:MAG: DUF6345 domain-containing protein [Verrucomicrobia bacterium]|jgi:hypothetical protein|nr:DUF6345 domain-containing protein [Verrucomicrobiota bacterium]